MIWADWKSYYTEHNKEKERDDMFTRIWFSGFDKSNEPIFIIEEYQKHDKQNG